MTIDHTVGYDEVAQTWRGIVHDDLKLPKQDAAQSNLQAGWKHAPDQYGATTAQMTDWVDHGRLADGMTLTRSGAQTSDRPKWRAHDFEGDLDVDRALAGDDLCFIHRQKRKREPGLTLKLQYNFMADVKAPVLADYAQWSAELIAGLQKRNFDLAIDVFSAVKMPGVGVVKTNVRVKRFGKRGSLKSWGALFAPSGYRMLGFTARMMACAEAGVACNPGMGASLAPGWDLSFDPKTRVLTVTCNSANAGSFPRELMNTKLAALKI